MAVTNRICALAMLAVGYAILASDADGQAALSVDGTSPVASAAPQATQETMSEGEYLARLGNCVACHTVPDGEPFAGGLKMAVPNVGYIYTTNITPDPETGIGNYTFEDFDRAMRKGITKEGRRMYPAMPYPSYAKMSESDMRAMYDYFMKEVKPVKQANIPEETSGWMSARWLLAIWNWLFLDDDPYESKPDQSAEWNRGAYLVEGLGHCGACHTPRGLLFQEKGMEAGDSHFLAGALLDHWSAPALNGDVNSGLGRWSVEDVAEFMKSGKNKFGTAFGTMVEVINTSTSYMRDEDLRAMAVYLKSLPPAAEKKVKPYEYDDTSTQQLTAFNFEVRGAQPYFEYCASCHGFDGRGAGVKMLPPLAGNPVVLDPRPDSLINLTLNGSLRLVPQGHIETFDMPPFYILMNDQQIADVVTFIRSAWGNQPQGAKPVTAKQVAEIRAATKPVGSDDIVILRMK
jgi:mono/diheme cytochrome c family protein